MKKKVTKSTHTKKVKSVSAVNTEPVFNTTIGVSDTAESEKPKVMFTPEVEKPAGEADKPAIIQPEAAVVSGVVINPTPAGGGQEKAGGEEVKIEPVTGTVSESIVKSEETTSETTENVSGNEETEATQEEKETYEMPGGELARSLNTLAGIADNNKKPEDKAQDSRDGGDLNSVEGEGVVKPGKKSRGSAVLGMMLAFIIGLCLGLLAGYWLWGQFIIGGIPVLVENEKKMDQQSQVETVTTPSPSPEAVAFERSEMKIKVLNGTGGKGVAAAGKEYLEGLGYVEVEVGNAKRSDYTETEVVISKDKSGFWPILKADLEKEYTLVDGFTTDEELLETSGGVDILIIIGE